MALKRRSAWFAGCPDSYRRGDRTAVAAAPLWRTCEPGMVIDRVRDLDLGANGQEDRPILSVCHKPRRPQPPDRRVIVPSAPPARGNQGMTYQRQRIATIRASTSAGI